MSRFEYRGDRLREVRFPLGGIGAGNVSLDGGARFVDWEIYNRPNKDSCNGFTHIAVKAERDGKLLDAKALNGPLRPPYMGRGLHGFGGYTYGPQRETLVGVPHFDDVTLTGRFPVAEYAFEGDFPSRARLKALSPFEPMNDFDSSLPVAMFKVELTNDTDAAIDYSIAFTMCNPDRGFPVNRLLTSEEEQGLLLTNGRQDAYAPAWGEACLLTDCKELSMQQSWYRGMWFDGLNMFWHDFTMPGKLKPRALEGYAETGPAVYEVTEHGVVCAHIPCAPGQTVSARFAMSWYYPNYEKYWGETAKQDIRPVWRNWYATQFTGAEAVARYALRNWDRLEGAVDAFVDTLYNSSLPEEVIDAAGSTLAVLKSPTCLRLTDGSFYAWEGSHAREGSCEGSCQHVWNYQYALPLLFPGLERSMRELDYKYNLQADGSMPFRLMLPPGSHAWRHRACVDGQMGGVIKSYREWKLSGDTNWLKGLWPSIKRSLEYAWSPENIDRWDPEQKGYMTGRQHQTLDMELFGPNSWLSGMYLAALEGAARMAEAVGEPEFAQKCRQMRENGSKYMDEALFNGEYYYHNVDLNDRSILEAFDVPNSRLGNDDVIKAYWNDELGEMKYQIGEGSSIDQLLGQWHADLCGLGDLYDRDNVKTALASVFKYNYVPEMGKVFNPCRLYCLQDEAGLIICAYPEGRVRPAISAPYAEETMHGFEYSAACHMILRGLEEEGLTCVRALRDRYDGLRRNPWNEIECGGNYARSMAAWSLVMAYQGFSADMTKGALGFSPLHAEDGHRSLWSVGGGWGSLSVKDGVTELTALGGSVSLCSLQVPFASASPNVTLDGKVVSYTVQNGEIVLDAQIQLQKGNVLRVNG